MIKEIAYQLTWEIRQKVMWPDRPIEYVKLDEDKLGKHFGLYVGDELTSIVSLFLKDGEAQFRKFATLESQQGKGHGTRLLQYLMSELQSMNVKLIWCNARKDKTTFYERFGMAKTDKRFAKGGIDYVIMERSLVFE
ncbi:MAG: GNAT family N-acetyltransferase [Cyclobacteriaceae bacterium]